MEKNIENIIRTKSYLELSEVEREQIKEWASSEEEFNQLKMVLLSVDSLSEKQEEELNPVIKQRLDVRFQEKFNKQRLVWYNKLWLFLWPQETQVVRKPLVHLVAVGLIVALVIPFLFQNDMGKKRLAVNDKSTQEESIQDVKKEEGQDKSSGSRNKQSKKLPNEQKELNEPAPSTDSKAEIKSNQKVLRMKDAEENADSDDRIDNVDATQGWYLSDEAAQAETLSVDEDRLAAEDALERDVNKNNKSADQEVFAGSLTRGAAEKTQLSTNRDQSTSSPKKVDTEKTIKLLAALY